MKDTTKLALFLAAWLATQGLVAARFHESETPHTHAEAMVSEPQPTTVVRSVSGAEIATVAHFNCPSCGGNLDILFPNCSGAMPVADATGTESCPHGRFASSIFLTVNGAE